MRSPHPKQTSYILRIWKSEHENQYRFIILDVLTGENWYFTDLNGLSGFLSAVLNVGSPVAPFLEETKIQSFVE